MLPTTRALMRVLGKEIRHAGQGTAADWTLRKLWRNSRVCDRLIRVTACQVSGDFAIAAAVSHCASVQDGSSYVPNQWVLEKLSHYYDNNMGKRMADENDEFRPNLLIRRWATRALVYVGSNHAQ